MMKIVIDDKIPFIKGVFERCGIETCYLPGAKTTASDVADADAIVTRTRTKCNETLLANSKVRFLASATIGFDHFDVAYLNCRNIAWTNAPGCNSGSVRQYIASLLVHLAKRRKFQLQDKTLGVVGVGNVGKKVAALGRAMGMKVLLNDPPRAEAEGPEQFVSLETLLAQSDIVTIHVPLERKGDHPTFHMGDNAFFNAMKPDGFLINASRGEVVDCAKLKNALSRNKIAGAALDVWENEPEIDQELACMLDFATPHIAGYSVDGKANGTSMSVQAIANFFNLPELKNFYPTDVPAPEKPVITLDAKTLQDQLFQAINATYDITSDTNRLRASFATFEAQRGSYPPRREFEAYTVCGATPEAAAILSQLGFKVQ